MAQSKTSSKTSKVKVQKYPVINPNAFEDFAILEGDCFRKLMEVEDESVNMLFADPPYFLSGGGISVKNGKQVCVDKGEWDKTISAKEILEFNRRWLELCKSKLTEDGVICVSGTRHNIHHVQVAMEELGYKIVNCIEWRKSNAAPLLCARKLVETHETIVVACKSEKSKYTFNYEQMKWLNGGKQMGDVWHLATVGRKEKKCGNHTTQKPLSLMAHLVLAFTNEGDRILDPFSGSGSTGIAASLLGRKYIGIELDSEYVQLSLRRRQEIENLKRRKILMERMYSGFERYKKTKSEKLEPEEMDKEAA